MTGTANVKPPKNDAEFARNTTRRLEAVENPESTRVGSWVLSTSPDTGNLIASHVDGGTTVLAEPPPPAQDPDEVVVIRPALILCRLTEVTVLPPQEGTVVAWNSIDAMVGAWGVTNSGGAFREVTVPTTGVYFIAYKVPFRNPTNGVVKSYLMLDGSVVAARENNAEDPQYETLFIMEGHSLTAGQKISTGVFAADAGVDFGVSVDLGNMATLSIIQQGV